MLDEACSWLWQLYSHSPITSSEYRPVKQVTAVELSLDLLQFIINAIRWDQHNENSKTDKQLSHYLIEKWKLLTMLKTLCENLKTFIYIFYVFCFNSRKKWTEHVFYKCMYYDT